MISLLSVHNKWSYFSVHINIWFIEHSFPYFIMISRCFIGQPTPVHHTIGNFNLFYTVRVRVRFIIYLPSNYLTTSEKNKVFLNSFLMIPDSVSFTFNSICVENMFSRFSTLEERRCRWQF